MARGHPSLLAFLLAFLAIFGVFLRVVLRSDETNLAERKTAQNIEK